MSLSKRLARLESAAGGGVRCPRCGGPMPDRGSPYDNAERIARELDRLPRQERDRYYSDRLGPTAAEWDEPDDAPPASPELIAEVRANLDAILSEADCPKCGPAPPPPAPDIPAFEDLRRMPYQDLLRLHRETLGHRDGRR